MFDIKKVYGNHDESIKAIFANGKVLVTRACLDKLREGCREDVTVEARGQPGPRWLGEVVE